MTSITEKSELSNQFDRLDHAWRIYLNAQDMIKYADQKVHVLLALSTLISSFILANLNSIVKGGIFERSLLGVFVIAAAFFFVFALFALLARKDSRTGDTVPRLVFFRHIQEKKEAIEYVQSFNNISLSEALADLCYQIYEVSIIAEKKFKSYRFAWAALSLQALTFVVLIVRITL